MILQATWLCDNLVLLPVNRSISGYNQYFLFKYFFVWKPMWKGATENHYLILRRPSGLVEV